MIMRLRTVKPLNKWGAGPSPKTRNPLHINFFFGLRNSEDDAQAMKGLLFYRWRNTDYMMDKQH